MTRIFYLLLAAGIFLGTLPGAPARTKRISRKRASTGVYRQPTYADSSSGDYVDGDDLAIRRAAVAALGRFNGSVVVADPQTGRILTIVNQKLAYQSGFQPCSTIKLVTAFAALREGLIERSTPLHLSRYLKLDLTGALEHSNNTYFALLGKRLGFERVSRYAQLFGLGERAALDLEGEQPGSLPEAEPANGGVGMMTSFGEGISLTPLELAGLLCAISNGGTLYYLQYPRSTLEINQFTPRVKRQLDIAPWITDVKMGMRAVVDSGTGHRANFDPNEPIMGKTGTCTDYKAMAHLGWFGSFDDSERHKLVVVVLLTGGKSVNGPVAAGVAGAVYKNLSDENFFARMDESVPSTWYATQACCVR